MVTTSRATCASLNATQLCTTSGMQNYAPIPVPQGTSRRQEPLEKKHARTVSKDVWFVVRLRVVRPGKDSRLIDLTGLGIKLSSGSCWRLSSWRYLFMCFTRLSGGA